MTTLLTMKGFNKIVQPITTAWIYHNPDLWLISLSSDWTNWITIADKNLWATQVYNDGDALSEANCGKYYQWWNNYGFPFTWTITTSTTRVDASNYWPWNYYSSSTFIKRSSSPYDWSNVQNDNLWWDVTDTNEARRWPCGDGYHVPTNTELSTMVSILSNIWITTWPNTKKYLKIPYAGAVSSADGTTFLVNQTAYLLSTTPGSLSDRVYYLSIADTDVYIGNTFQRAGWANIRPFANTPVQPDDSRTVLYQYHEPEYLCFTANTANSTVQLTKTWSPTVVSLETSTDWNTWADYTIWDTITLSNIWDKVYMRNKSETATGFSTYVNNNYYRFVMSGSISGSWDVNYLLCKNSTDTLSDYCFNRLFYWCTSLTTPPKLTATTLAQRCYNSMFYSCALTSIPQLIALSYPDYACVAMFGSCVNIKLSTTQTWEYQTPYRIPTEWTGTVGNSSLLNMFQNTWWTFTWTPTINTTYYTSNTVI